MSFDMYLVPSSGFLDWNSDRWDAFFESDPDSVCLGKSVYIGWVLDAISHNLEGDKLGSKFPMLMRMEVSDPLGWYADEVPLLVHELSQIKVGLRVLPISIFTLNCERDDQVRQRVEDFQKVWPGRSAQSVYDLHFYFFDEFEKLAAKALTSGQGLYVAF